MPYWYSLLMAVVVSHARHSGGVGGHTYTLSMGIIIHLASATLTYMCDGFSFDVFWIVFQW